MGGGKRVSRAAAGNPGVPGKGWLEEPSPHFCSSPPLASHLLQVLGTEGAGACRGGGAIVWHWSQGSLEPPPTALPLLSSSPSLFLSSTSSFFAKLAPDPPVGRPLPSGVALGSSSSGGGRRYSPPILKQASAASQNMYQPVTKLRNGGRRRRRHGHPLSPFSHAPPFPIRLGQGRDGRKQRGAKGEPQSA